MSRLRVAVTGAAGNVGSALVKGLAANGEFEVVALVRNELAAKTLGPVDAEIRIGSITDQESSRRMLAGCGAVINCALPKGLPRNSREQSDAILSNIASAPDVRIAVHFSSVAVYGACVDPRTNSFERPRPTSTYGIEKLRSENVAARLFSKRGIGYHIMRLGHVYGPAQWISSDILLRTTDPAFALPFGGNVPSNAVSIYAVIEAIRGMLNGTQPIGVRNLVDAPQSTWRELFDFHTELLGRPAALSMTDRESHAWQSRYFAESRGPVRTVLRATKASLRSAELFRVTQHIAFRRLVNGLLSVAPSWMEQSSRHAYVQRKAAVAVRQLAGGREPPAQHLCMPPVPGPSFATIHKHAVFAAMTEELRTYLRRMSSYRWDMRELASDALAQGSTVKVEATQQQDAALVARTA